LFSITKAKKHPKPKKQLSKEKEETFTVVRRLFWQKVKMTLQKNRNFISKKDWRQFFFCLKREIKKGRKKKEMVNLSKYTKINNKQVEQENRINGR
jgi:16S rRNA A1518/A1519 N6-dimethyltransferase RsmA/KsgA/DIM1 with predicted DNA glycosylase/AP lyase activity